MPRLQTMLECIGVAVRDNGGLAGGLEALGDSFVPTLRTSHQLLTSRLSEADLRAALREAVGAPQDTVELSLRDAVASVTENCNIQQRAALTSFLELFPPTLRQAMRRPGDPAGTSIPEQLPVGKVEDWATFLAPGLTRFKSGEVLAEFDEWQLVDLRGESPGGETWQGWSANHPENATASLKFITNPRIAGEFAQYEDHFRRVLDLDAMSGLVQLRSVYLLGDPPCLESPFVSGYDSAGLIRDWKLGADRSKPDRAALIIRRAAKIVGQLHSMEEPIVHRGLKPSNILMHPTADGKVSIWISDIGWGEISSTYALQHSGKVDAYRDSRRGAYSPLYASPQFKQGEPADPRDDVYSLGVVWYQLLKRDAAALPPKGTEWALEFREDGLSDGHARLLAACLEEDPEERPDNGMALSARIDSNFGKPTGEGSKTFVLKGTTTTLKPVAEKPSKPVAAKTAKSSLVVDMPRAFKNSIGMEFVLLPAGSFMMGSPVEEKGRHDWEGPIHIVHISRPFYLGVYPVTQGQYQQIMGRNPSHFTKVHGGSPDHPVEQVSWDDATAFCERLTALPNEMALTHIYRLPSEAEWEYACRGGTTTAYYFGDTVSLEQVHYFGLNASTYSKVVSTAGKTEKVGSHPGNPRGLFDMHGNVLEWCNDWWSEDYYGESPEIDPIGPPEGWHRVVRGGSFSQFAPECRSAARLGRAPGGRLNSVGFRVALMIPGA